MPVDFDDDRLGGTMSGRGRHQVTGIVSGQSRHCLHTSKMHGVDLPYTGSVNLGLAAATAVRLDQLCAGGLSTVIGSSSAIVIA